MPVAQIGDNEPGYFVVNEAIFVSVSCNTLVCRSSASLISFPPCTFIHMRAESNRVGCRYLRPGLQSGPEHDREIPKSVWAVWRSG